MHEYEVKITTRETAGNLIAINTVNETREKGGRRGEEIALQLHLQPGSVNEISLPESISVLAVII